jgi:LmbE family N-acetylglucosaminyl deacetylase
MSRRALVFAPHADDTELGCGATVAAMADAGWDVAIVIACMSDYRAVRTGGTVTASARLTEAIDGAKVLGARLYGVYDGRENELHLDTRSRFVGYLEAALDDLKPDTLFVCLKSFNQDHTALWDATMAVLRPSRAGHQPATVLAYEYPMNCWSDPGLDRTFGRRYVPLSARNLVQKLAALKQHESQMMNRRHTITGDAGVRALARMRGLECGTEAAEMFHVLREVRDVTQF